jgi:hypothetical protein
MLPSSFLGDFFRDAEGSIFVCSLANEKKSGQRVFELCGRGDGTLLDEKVQHWDLKDRGTFFCVATLTPNQARRSKDTVHQIVCLHADIDLKDVDLPPDAVLARLRQLQCLPSKIVHSGHGFHTYWLLNEPLAATAETIPQVETLLRSLANIVGGDPSVCEISRLMRLPGSYNTKNGERVAVQVVVDRPLRYELGDLAEWISETPPLIQRKNAVPTDNPYLGVNVPGCGGAPVDIEARLRAMQHQGPGDTSVHATQLAVTAALLNRGVGTDKVVDTVLTATRAAAGNAGTGWDWTREERDVRRMCDTWRAKKLNGREPPPSLPQDDALMTFEELGAMQFEPPKFLVPGLIPAEGVTLICSKPKAGKSWMCLDLVLTVAMNRDFLGDRRPMQGNALLLALEDSKRRLRSRGEKLLAGHLGVWPRTVTVATRWPRVDQDGLDRIRRWALDVRDGGGTPVVVVIDVLKMVRPSGQEKKTISAQDYECLQGLRVLAHELNLAVVVTHHVRKTAADDVQDTISGSLGLSASADCTIVLERQPDGNFTLDARGRDVEHVQLAVVFNKDTCRWTISGNASEVRRTENQRAIREAMQSNPEGASPQDIGAETGIKPSTVRSTLLRMVRSGEAKKVRGKYVIEGGAREP